jgi:DNA repair protein RadC
MRKIHQYEVESRIQMVKGSPVADRVMDKPELVAELTQKMIGGKPKEHMLMIAVSARFVPIGVVKVSIGTLSASLVHPREVFGPAILLNAAAIILAHNHPSGDTSPSAEDKEATRRMSKAGELLGIPLIDHLIVSPDNYFSFKAAQLL